MRLSDDTNIHDIVLIMTAVNHIDLSAQEMLCAFNQSCIKRGQHLHLAEVKGPMMDILKTSPVIENLSGCIF